MTRRLRNVFLRDPMHPPWLGHSFRSSQEFREGIFLEKEEKSRMRHSSEIRHFHTQEPSMPRPPGLKAVDSQYSVFVQCRFAFATLRAWTCSTSAGTSPSASPWESPLPPAAAPDPQTISPPPPLRRRRTGERSTSGRRTESGTGIAAYRYIYSICFI